MNEFGARCARTSMHERLFVEALEQQGQIESARAPCTRHDASATRVLSLREPVDFPPTFILPPFPLPPDDIGTLQ